MSMFSAFGFSGYDPIGSLMENQDNTLWGQMNNTFNGMRDWYYAKKASARQAALQWEYQKKAALEMPTLQRRGLIAAGFNPLLAIANGIHSPSSMPVSASSPINGGHVPSAPNGSAGFDAQKFFSARNVRRLTDATVKTVEANADKASLENDKTESEIENIEADTRSKNIGAVTKGVGAAAAGVGAGVGVYNALKYIKHKPVLGFSSSSPVGFSSSAPVGASSAPGSAFTSARMLGGITAAGLAYPMAMYALGKYLESKGYEPPKGNDNERNHRMSGLNMRKVDYWKPDSKKNIRNKFRHK